MRLKPLIAALALASVGPAMAETCTNAVNWGSLGPPGFQWFGNWFSSTGSYLDCYTFSIGSAADSFGGTVAVDPSGSLNIDLGSVSLFSGGLSGGNTSGALVGADYSPGSFSFSSLLPGDYTLAVSSTVTDDPQQSNDWWVGYGGGISTTATSVASPAPEPATYAMMLAGLALVGAAVRRRDRR